MFLFPLGAAMAALPDIAAPIVPSEFSVRKKIFCMFREISPLDRPEQVEYHATIKRIWRELDANVGT